MNIYKSRIYTSRPTPTKNAFVAFVVLGLLVSIGAMTPVTLIAQGKGPGDHPVFGSIPGHCPDGYEKIEYEGSLSWTADQDYESVILVGAAPDDESNQDPDGRFKYVGAVEEGETVSRDKHEISFVCVKPGEPVEEPEPPVDPDPEYVTIVATKLVCEDASMLPQNTGTYNINENTVDEYLNKGCSLKSGWEFQWSFEAPANSPDNEGELSAWNTSEKTDSNGQTEMVINEEELGDNKNISVREVWSDDYIEFAGAGKSGDSAEFYCETDGKNLDNFEYIFDAKLGETYHCVAWNVPVEEEVIPEPDPEYATVIAHKIVCGDDDEMPKYGEGGNYKITENTATEWVAQNDSCEFVNGWKFQWAPEGTENPGDDLYGEAGDPWTTSVPTVDGKATLELTAEDIDGMSYIWVREVLKNGYIPFTYGLNDNSNTDDYSAEMYCHTDVLNYDNYDRVDGIEVNNTYYCVAWNMQKKTVHTPPEDNGKDTKVEKEPEETQPTTPRSRSVSGAYVHASPAPAPLPAPEGIVEGIEDTQEEQVVAIIPTGAPDTGMGGAFSNSENTAWPMALALMLLTIVAFVPTKKRS